MKLYAHPDKYLTKKMLIAADYAGLDIEIPKNAGKDDVGRIPVLETEKGCIFSTGAIARYLCRLRRDVPLYGNNLLEAGMIDSWTEFSTNELEVPLSTWVNHANGSINCPADVIERAKADTQKALTVVNNHLLNFTYMVGEEISLADISLCCAIVDGVKLGLLSQIMGSLGNVTRWYKLCTMQPQFEKLLGKQDAPPAKGGKKEAAAPKPAAAKKEAAPKAEGKKEAPKKEEKPKAAPAPAAPKPAAGGPVDEAAVKACGDKIRELKAKLKEEGVSGKKIDAHPDVAALVKQLQELKAGGGGGGAAAAPAAKADAAPKKDSKKDKKGGEAKKEEEKPKSAEDLAAERKKKEKKVIKEGGKRGVEIDGAADMGGLAFFCTSVDEPDGDLELLDMCMTAMNAESDPTEEERKGGSGRIGKMIFSAGTDQLAIIAYVPKEKKGECDAREWLKKVLDLHGGTMDKKSTDLYATGTVKADQEKGKFPLKLKDPSITEAITYLKSKGLFPDKDDSDDDEFVFGDDDFPS